jgi:LPXTG-motif cell wall-anchored protein
MDYRNRKQIFSLRKFKGVGLASAVIASMFFAQGVSADVVANPNGTTTISNDKASIVVKSNHYKESQDKTASELYREGSYTRDKETTGTDTKQVESKTIVKYETENHTPLEADKEVSSTETVSQDWKQSGVSGKEITGTDTKPTVNSNLEKKDVIEKDGTKYKYVRTETSEADNSTLSEEHFNDVTTKATNAGLHKADGSINYSNIPNGSRVWVLEEKEDGTYGNYALIEKAQDLSDEKIQEAAKTATTKFSKAEVERLGGIKDTDSIVVYESNTYAARKQTSEHFGRDFYYANTANESLFRKDIIDKIFEAGLEGLEKRGNSYFYKGVEVPTIENFKTIPGFEDDNKISDYPTDTNNKYYTNEPAGYTVPTTYYNVINDFFIKNPESEIFKNKANEVFWGANSGDLLENTEEAYSRLAFVTDILNKSLKDKYNIDEDTQDFKNKTLESKSNNNRPVFEKKYSFKKTDLHDNVKSWEETFDSLLDKKLWIREISNSYSIENVKKVRNLIKAYQNLYGEPTTDVFNDKNDSDVTINEYAEAIYNKITSLYIETYKDQFTEEGAKAIKNKFGNSPILKIGDRVDDSLDSSQKDMTVQSASEFYRNSPGVITENTETFTYHDVITPLRAYRLNAGENVVRHIYKEVPKGSVIATYRDEAGNDLIDTKQVKTNESEGTAYNTQSETIAPKVTTETTPEGFTKTITKTYELIAEPQNKDGEVIGNQTITVPYVYRVTTDTVINGSVIATYKDTDGNVLAPQEAIKTNVAPNEAYTTNSKEIPSTTETVTTPEGLKKTITTSYELVENPTNKDGSVEGGKTIVVPYVYRKIVNEVTNGSVIATYKDTDGNVLAPQEAVKTNVAPNEAYTTTSKDIPSTTETVTTSEGLTKTITTSYELVENPTNKDGVVESNKTIVVPYVYRKIINEVTNGSVIATYKDTDGNVLAPQEAIKTNVAPNEAYTTNAKEIPSTSETTTTPEGFTKTTTISYELVSEPQNKNGAVEGNKTIVVPYVYRKIVNEVTNGSVIATYKDTEGNELAPQEAIKTNVAPNEAYTTNAKEIPAKTITEVLEDGSTKTTTITYELVENPTNKDGEVQGGKTITVPYVYNKKVTEVITPKPQPEKPKEDKPKEDKLKEETPKETPKTNEKPKEVPKTEEPKPKDAPKVEQPKETPKPKDEPKETPKEVEKPKGNTPKVEQPKETPKDNPKNEKPNVPIREEQPKSKEIPQTDKPKEDNSKEIPKKDSNPVNEPVKSQVQKTELPNTGAKQDSTGVLGLISLLLSGGLLSLKRRKNAE